MIRGHGIPEAMEAVLVRQSRIAPRTAIAKPLSSAIAIGTGGPFGAEGPIIVTGGALGSLLGQVLHVSANERKILLASGAAAGMAATFGTPLAAVVLAIELLLFEFSARAFVPLVVATSVAGAVHAALFGSGPLFAVPAHDFAGLAQLPWFALLGIGCGLLATLIATRPVRRRARLPPPARVGESWHPIIGALVWAPIGLLVPRVLGVGYDVIDDALAGRLAVGDARRPRRRQARRLVDRAGVGHLGRHARADPADQLVRRRRSPARRSTTSCRPCRRRRSPSWRWPPRSAPPPGPRSRRSCSSSS